MFCPKRLSYSRFTPCAFFFLFLASVSVCVCLPSLSLCMCVFCVSLFSCHTIPLPILSSLISSSSFRPSLSSHPYPPSLPALHRHPLLTVCWPRIILIRGGSLCFSSFSFAVVAQLSPVQLSSVLLPQLWRGVGAVYNANHRLDTAQLDSTRPSAGVPVRT